MTRRPPPRPAAYHLLSAADKQKLHRGKMREPAVACPRCETQTTVADLPRHLSTCAGPRDPHPLSEWLTWTQALALGVRQGTLSKWVASGKVRARGRRWRRQYLRRDIARRIAESFQVETFPTVES